MDEQAYWRWRRWKECGQKVGYLTEAAAERNAPKPQVAYQCTFCKFWHTGHPKQAKTGS
jgi:hypothetical protein